MLNADDIDCQQAGDHGWTWSVSPDELQKALKFIFALPQKTWGEITQEMTGGHRRHKKHHDQPVSTLASSVQERLHQHLGDDMPDTLFRFRYSGKGRIWGVRDRAVFQVIWLDHEHQVYPTEKE